MAVIIQRVDKSVSLAVAEALKAINYLPLKDKIFIKPNIVNPFLPHEPYITNPQVVAGIIDYLQEKGLTDIVVGEGPVGDNVEEIFRYCGYEKMCAEKNVELVNLEKAARTNVAGIMLPAILLEREYINVAKLKTHIQTTVTLGIKNQKGLLNIKTKRAFHANLHENIVRLATVISPALTIIDALNGVEGNGPGRMGAEVSNINLLLAGKNMVEVDIIGATIMGFDWRSIVHIQKLHEAGRGGFPNEILGEDLNLVKRKFAVPTKFQKFQNIYYWWTDSTCSGCSNIMGEVKALALKNPYYLMRLFFYGFLQRLDLLTGEMDNCPADSGKVLCIGECTRKIAQKHNFTFIKGCPPDPKDILKKI